MDECSVCRCMCVGVYMGVVCACVVHVYVCACVCVCVLRVCVRGVCVCACACACVYGIGWSRNRPALYGNETTQNRTEVHAMGRPTCPPKSQVMKVMLLRLVWLSFTFL